MQEVGHGNLAVRAPVKGNDEIAYLSQSFNEMLQRMNDLIEHLATEREQKKEAELKALQYQIRPHFIYNMLNAIRFAAMMQEPATSAICWRTSSSCCGPVPTGTVRSCHFQKKSRPCATTLPCRNSACWMHLTWRLTCKTRPWTASCRA